MSVPSFLQIEVSAECNLRCTMCAIRYRVDHRAGGRALMPFETYRDLIDQCAGVRRVHLQGLGEPLLHPRFFDMVAYAAGKGVQVTTNSNLLLLDGTRAEKMVSSGLADLYVSVDGATKETYERIRVNGNFNTLARNLRLLQRVRAGRSSELPRVRMVMVAMRKNLFELPLLVRFAGHHGIRSVFVQHLCHDFAEQSLRSGDVSTVRRVFAAARRVARKRAIELHLPKVRPLRKDEPEGCEWPWKGIYVTWRGEIMPCCMVSSADRISFGTVSCGSIPRLWNSAVYRAFRDSIANRTPPSVCRTCPMYWGVF